MINESTSNVQRDLTSVGHLTQAMGPGTYFSIDQFLTEFTIDVRNRQHIFNNWNLMEIDMFV